MKPKLSLVTGTVNRHAAFARLVASVVAHTSAPWEMVVTDASDVPVECGDERVLIIPERPRMGHSRGYNAAFKQCRGEFVIWLNDDAEVCGGYDTEAMAFMEAHPRIGLGCLHYSENGGPFHINSAWGVPYANFGIIRRVVGNQVGWFDEELTMYGADNSIAFRVLMHDYGIADIPHAKVIHHSEKDQVRAENQKSRAADNQRLQNKYMPHRRQWTAAFQRNRVATGTAPWAHGRQPQMVGT